MRHLEKLKLYEKGEPELGPESYGYEVPNSKQWEDIIKDYEKTKSTWNAAAFGYLTFENFLRYNYNPPTKKK